MSIKLRDYQVASIEALRDHIRHGARNLILCASTGAGKTVMAAHLIAEAQSKGKRSAFVADRIPLIHQTSAVLDQHHLPHGVIQAGHWRWQPHQLTQVASVQTLARRKWPDTSLIIVDEAHALHRTVTDRIGKRDCVTVGLTATPFTRGMGKHYDAVVSVTTLNRLTSDGHLVPFEVFAPSEPDMTGAKVVAGEWSEDDAASRALPIVGDCVREYLARGEGNKFIAFGCNVAHCEALRDQFLSSGIQVGMYTYRDSDETREQLMAEFRKPDSYVRGLISVAALSKGLDVPDIGVVILARPLRNSFAEHLQMIGRGLRPYTGKDKCIILDHAGNCNRFWGRMAEFFENGEVELDDGIKKPKETKPPKEKEPMRCPKCAAVHDPAPFCPRCGTEYRRKSEIIHQDGILLPVGGITQHHKTDDVWPQIVALAHESGRTEKWALAVCKSITGRWPSVDFAKAVPAIPTPETRARVRNHIRRYFLLNGLRSGKKNPGRMAVPR